MVTKKIPPRPKACLELDSLNDRMGQVSDWTFKAVNDVYAYRTKALAAAQHIESLKLRSETHAIISDRLEKRLQEIDETEEIFKIAYEEVRKELNLEEVLEYGTKILPMVQEQAEIENKKRFEQAMKKSKEKTAAAKEKELKNKEKEKILIRRLEGEGSK